MTRIGYRRCFDCGATEAEATFPGVRKPTRRRDKCTDCASAPLAEFRERVAARREQIAALRAAGRFKRQQPFHTAPLFAGLRPGSETQPNMPALDAAAGGEN